MTSSVRWLFTARIVQPPLRFIFGGEHRRLYTATAVLTLGPLSLLTNDTTVCSEHLNCQRPFSWGCFCLRFSFNFHCGCLRGLHRKLKCNCWQEWNLEALSIVGHLLLFQIEFIPNETLGLTVYKEADKVIPSKRVRTWTKQLNPNKLAVTCAVKFWCSN